LFDGRSPGVPASELLSPTSFEKKVDDTGMVAIPSWFFYTETIAWHICALGLALCIPDLAILSDIMGFTAGVLVIFVLPGAFVMRIPSDWLLEAYSDTGIDYKNVKKCGMPLIALGIVAGAAAAYAFVARLVNPS